MVSRVMGTKHDEHRDGEQGAGASPSMVPSISTRRLHVIVLGLWLCLSISTMDSTIVTTALIKISSSFGALDRASWLVTAYLLTYNAFLLISAKLSDVWGLKTVLLAFNVFFLIFSMACGGAQSMIQLIIFRAFQGIGGSGLFSLVFIGIMKLITPDKMPFYSGVISSAFALANLLGPILGGVISDRSSWRWIFFINGPIVGTIIVLLFCSMPGINDGKSHKDRFKSFDVVGGFLSVSWLVPLLFALQEGGAHYEWKSGAIIGTLVAGITGLIFFGCYEAWITYRTKKDAVFPFSLLTDPPMMILLLSIFLLGVPFYGVIIQLPQRFQAVNHTSAERAGILLLPLTLMTPVGSMIAGSIMGKFLAAEYILIISAAFISVGIGLLSSLPVESAFWAGTYGYQIIAGIGLGLANPPYYYLLYTTVDQKEIAVATGALNMMRTLGGCVSIAICTALHHSFLRSRLPKFFAWDDINLIEESSAFIATLSPEAQETVARISGRSYNRQFQVLVAFACLNVLVTSGLAVLRKRNGTFGLGAQRMEENELMTKDARGESAIDQSHERLDEKGDAATDAPRTEVKSLDKAEAIPVGS